MAGPNIIVSGAVFANKLIAQTLTDYISVIPRPHVKLSRRSGRSLLDEACHRVATLFRALKTCIEELNVYYERLLQSLEPALPPRVRETSRSNARVYSTYRSAGTRRAPHMIGPHFTTYQSSDKEEFVLKYKKLLVTEDVTKAVFLADAQRGSEVTPVVVKFAHNYGAEGHRLLAATGHAPVLHYCAYEESVAMWVVVMEYVRGESDCHLVNSAHAASLHAAVTTLHRAGLVFGDLRRPNVLCVDDWAVLIDFDWCGKEGEARYPSDILLEGWADWHNGVEWGGLIEREHDAYVFSCLTRQDLCVDDE